MGYQKQLDQNERDLLRSELAKRERLSLEDTLFSRTLKTYERRFRCQFEETGLSKVPAGVLLTRTKKGYEAMAGGKIVGCIDSADEVSEIDHKLTECGMIDFVAWGQICGDLDKLGVAEIRLTPPGEVNPEPLN